jgi:hypothetical protein
VFRDRTGNLFCTAVALLGMLALASCDRSTNASRREESMPLARTCVGNLKEVGTALLLYAGDNQGTLPLAHNWGTASGVYAKSAAFYSCPESTSGPGYAMHERLVGVKTALVANPKKTALVFDALAGEPNAVGALALLPEPPRHTGINNALFADNHVAPVVMGEAAAGQP